MGRKDAITHNNSFTYSIRILHAADIAFQGNAVITGIQMAVGDPDIAAAIYIQTVSVGAAAVVVQGYGIKTHTVAAESPDGVSCCVLDRKVFELYIVAFNRHDADRTVCHGGIVGHTKCSVHAFAFFDFAGGIIKIGPEAVTVALDRAFALNGHIVELEHADKIVR